MTHLRCLNPNCAAVFEADAGGACPKCAAGGQEITPVHYLVVSADGPIFTGAGPRMLACLPARAKLPKAATGERLAVTCLRCQATAIFAEDARDGADMHVDYIERKLAAEHGPALRALADQT